MRKQIWYATLLSISGLLACGGTKEVASSPTPPVVEAVAPAMPASVAPTQSAAADVSSGVAQEPPAPKAESADPHAVDIEIGRRFGNEARKAETDRGATPAPAAASAGTAFGLYLLALSWAPNFCCGHESKQQCDGLAASFGATHLTLHGLWPNYTDAEAKKAKEDYPTYCGNKECSSKHPPKSCLPDPNSIPADMAKYGPGYVTDNNFLANHEWPKHGSCSGLDAKNFFSDTISALLKLPGDSGTPKALHDKIGSSIKTTELAKSFGEPQSVALSCDKSCNLMQVGICLAHDAKGNPTKQIACPQNVMKSNYDNSCVTNNCAEVKIQKAGECSATGGGGSQPEGKCTKPGQGPACSNDQKCIDEGFLRCAKSGCCTSIPL
jgi:ribonuclease T2